jgi:hypothetical protein
VTEEPKHPIPQILQVIRLPGVVNTLADGGMKHQALRVDQDTLRRVGEVNLQEMAAAIMPCPQAASAPPLLARVSRRRLPCLAPANRAQFPSSIGFLRALQASARGHEANFHALV